MNLPRTCALLLIITVATGLRFLKLDAWSFWLDEALTVSDSLYYYNLHGAWEVIHSRPLNFWITGWAFSFLPVSEWSARLVPCLVGAITVPVVYLLSRDFLGNTAALLSSMFLSLSTWHIYWSQNARGYTLLLLFSVISMTLFYMGVEKGNRLLLLASVLTLGIAYLAHPVALFVLLAYCVYLVLIALTRFDTPAGYCIKVLWVFFLPLILLMIFTLPGIVGLAGKVLNTSQPGNPFYVLASTGYYVQPLFMVLGISGSAFLIFRRSRLGLFLACLMIIPLISLLVLSATRGGSSLYVFHTLPLYYMAAAIVVTEITKALDPRVKVLAIAVILALLSLQTGLIFEYFTYQYGDRPRWKEATAYVTSVTNPSDVIASTSAPVVEYYLGSPTLRLRSPERAIWFETRDLQNLPSSAHPTWLLLTADSLDGGHEGIRFERWLRRYCTIMRIFEARTSAKNRSVLIYRCQ